MEAFGGEIGSSSPFSKNSFLIQDSEEGNSVLRATSWLEFVLEPSLFTEHLEGLKSKRVRNPNGFDLIKIFLKQAQYSSNYSTILHKFAAQVALTLDLSLEEIIEKVPLKFQLQLLEDICQNNKDLKSQINLHRWFLHSRASENSTASQVETSVKFLFDWIQSLDMSQISSELANTVIQTVFDLAYYSLIHNDIAEAQKYFLQAQHLLRQFQPTNLPISEEKLNGFLVSCKIALNESTIPELKDSPILQIDSAVKSGNSQKLIELLLHYIGTFNPIISADYIDTLIEISQGFLQYQLKLCLFLFKALHGESCSTFTELKALNINVLLSSLFSFLKEILNLENISKKEQTKLAEFILHFCLYFDSPITWKSFFDFEQQYPIFSDYSDLINQIKSNQMKSFVKEPFSSNLQYLNQVTSSSKKIWISSSTEELKQNLMNSPHSANSQNVLVQTSKRLLNQDLFQEAFEVLSLNIFNTSPIYYQNIVIQMESILSTLKTGTPLPSTHSSVVDVSNLIMRGTTEFGLPEFDVLEKILGFLLTTDSFSIAREYCSQVISQFNLSEHHNTMAISPYTSLCAFCSDLAFLTETLLSYQNTVITENFTLEAIQENGEKIESIYFRMMDLLTKSTEEGLSLIHFNPAHGILSRIRTSSPINPSTVLNVLLSLFAGIMHHLRRLKKVSNYNDPDVERYGFICSMVGKHAFVTANPCPTPPIENAVRSCFTAVAKKLNQLSFESKYLFARGDAFFEEADSVTHNPDTHKEAIKNYLLAAGQETAFFTLPGKLSRHFNGIIKRLITSLYFLKYNTQAAVLCQFLQPIDFNFIFKILQENIAYLDPSYFLFFWELPIFEVLVHIYSKPKDKVIQNFVINLIGRPEVNEYNSNEVRETFVEKSKISFLKTLRKEFIF